MVEINHINSFQLIDAVCMWTGWGQSKMPIREDAKLVEYLGKEEADKLLPVIRALEEDFYSSNARFVATDLREMEKLSSENFKQKYPNIADEIVKAFAWCYSFDFK